MEAAERELAGHTERMSAGQHVGGEPTPSGHGVEALKDILFGSVGHNSFSVSTLPRVH